MDVKPPAQIEGLPELRPSAPLEFSRAWLAKMERVRARRAELQARGELNDLAPAAAAAEGAALTGTLRIPVIPVLYKGQSAPFPTQGIEQRLFGSTRGDTVSFSDYWREVSGGLLKVEGQVAPWSTLPENARHYLPREQFGWSQFGDIADFRRDAINAADASIDFRQFDNDGPDGIPDSGDDDGFVDFVALMYALPCPGDGREGAIWPHRAAMAPIATHDLSRVTGQPLKIADYVILPAVEIENCAPLQIGVLAHETGHALGLPDLYDYDGSSAGIGGWGLMGTGSHTARWSPAHLDAWSKEQLGWVRVTWIQDTAALALPPVETEPHIYRFDEGDVSERYLLFENRQRLGSDRFLPGEGLLVWEIDPERGELGAWNTDERRAAVRLIQADGRDDLLRGQRADAGDPWPGTRGSAFESQFGEGLEISALRDSAGEVLGRVRPGGGPALTLSSNALRMTALMTGGPVRQMVRVERRHASDLRWGVRTRESWLHVERVGDVLLLSSDPTGLYPGVYVDTLRVVDSREVPLAEMTVSFHVASVGFSQIVATELPWSWGLAAHNGRILHASYGWDPLGLRPRPRVLQLLEGSTHPGTLVRIPADALYAPVLDPASGQLYVLAQARNQNYLYRVDPQGNAELVASAFLHGEPAYGAALHRDGSVLVAGWDGQVERIDRNGNASLYARFNQHVYQIATDGEGNLFAAAYSGDVLRLTPSGTSSVLKTGFESGKLVAVAAAPDGSVIAGERGGEGRIVRVQSDGKVELLFKARGAHYYGLATDNQFVYALDLGARQLLRIPLPGKDAAMIAAAGK